MGISYEIIIRDNKIDYVELKDIEYAKHHQIDFLARNITITDLNGCHYIHGYEIQDIYDFWDEL